MNGIYVHSPNKYDLLNHKLTETIINLREIRKYIKGLDVSQSADVKLHKVLTYISDNKQCEYITSEVRDKKNCQVVLSNQSKLKEFGGFYLDVETLVIRLNLQNFGDEHNKLINRTDIPYKPKQKKIEDGSLDEIWLINPIVL